MRQRCWYKSHREEKPWQIVHRDEKRECRDWRPRESEENERNGSTLLAISSGTKRIDESEAEIVLRIKYSSGKEKIIKSNEPD